MLIGKLSNKWSKQSVCLFCTLRARKALSFSSRQVHSSQKTLYESTSAHVKNDNSRAENLYGAGQSDQQDSPRSEAAQSGGDLYGVRYTTRKLPSWKLKSAALQQPAPKFQSTVVPPTRSQPNSQVIKGIGDDGRKTQQKSDTQPLNRRTTFNEDVSRSTPAAAALRTSEMQRASEPDKRQPSGKSFNAVDSDNTYKTGRTTNHSRGLAHSMHTVLPPISQHGGTGAKQNEISLAGEGADSPSFGGGRKSFTTETQDMTGSPERDLRVNSARLMPKWNNLPRKPERPSEPSPTTDDGGIARVEPLSEPGSTTDDDGMLRFKPFSEPQHRKFQDAPVAKPSDNDSTVSRRDRQPEGTRAMPLSSDYVGFRESASVARTKANVDATPESVSRPAITATDRLSKDLEPDDTFDDSRFKGRRKKFYLQEEDAYDKKSAKAKYGKASRGYAADEDDGLDADKLERIEARQRRKAERKATRDEQASGQVFVVPSFISIGNLASSLKIRADAFSVVLRSQGFAELSKDHILDAETAGLIASELGFKVVLPAKMSKTDIVAQPAPKDTDFLPSRPPIVTIMGHVDHGKTTLLDWLRNSSVAASEHGGITQHIGAFTVQMPSGRIITFLDTPGHAAFLEMRARGANVTDIVILVVAADDSVKPQTIEAIKHAKAARTQVIVAISKIDKPEADPDRVKQDLARNGIEVEDFGGDTQVVSVSGKTGQGMDQLEDAVIALADVLDVKADTSGNVEGWVLEGARKASGKIATVLVRRGTLRPGQIIVAGNTWARVRNMFNEAGVVASEALPGTPVEIDGWDEQPEAGAEVLQATNEQKARRVVDYRKSQAQLERQTAEVAVVNEARKAHEEKRMREKARAAALAAGEEVEEEVRPMAKPGLTEVPLIVKADVSGSIEAVDASVLSLGNSEIRPIVIRSAVGNVSESDVEHAAAVKGHLVNFNLAIDGDILRLAEQSGVKIIDGNIIYRITDDVKSLLEDYLPPLITHHVTGEADILQIFEINIKGKKSLSVAGCKIRNGVMLKGSKAKVIRGERVVYEGILSTLKNVKKDVTEMRKGNECGLSFDDFEDFSVGDQVQCFETKSQKRRL